MNVFEFDKTSKQISDPYEHPTDDDEAYEPGSDHWTSGDLLCLASSVLRSGDKNWLSVSRSLKPFGDLRRPSEWHTPKKCAVQYSKLLKRVDDKKKLLPRTERETPEELLVKHLSLIRLHDLHSNVDESRILGCKLRSVMEMVEAGDIDHNLDVLLSEVEKQEKNFEESYCEWVTQRETSPSKRSSKYSPSLTKGKASAPRMEEYTYGKQASMLSEGSEHDLAGDSLSRDVSSGEFDDDSPNSVKPSVPLGETDRISPTKNVGPSSTITAALSQHATSFFPDSIASSSSSATYSLLENKNVGNISSQISPRPVSSPQPFFNPTSALASAAARQLAVATATMPHSHLLARRTDTSDIMNPSSSNTANLSSVSSVTLSAPTLSKLLEMPPSVPGKLPPLPTAFYTSDYLQVPSAPSQHADSPQSTSPKKAVVSIESVGPATSSKESYEFPRIRQLSIWKENKESLESAPCTIVASGNQQKVVSPEQTLVAPALDIESKDNKEPFSFKLHGTPEKQTSQDIQQLPKVEKQDSSDLNVASESDNKSKAVDLKQDASSRDSVYEDYICSTSETDDSSSESSMAQTKSGSKDSPNKSAPDPSAKSLDSKRKRKHLSVNSLSLSDSSEDGERSRHLLDNVSDKSSNKETTPITLTEMLPLAVSAVERDTKRRKGDMHSAVKNLNFDAENICQSPNEAINFLKHLDSIEKKATKSSGSFHSSNQSTTESASDAALDDSVGCSSQNEPKSPSPESQSSKTSSPLKFHSDQLICSAEKGEVLKADTFNDDAKSTESNTTLTLSSSVSVKSDSSGDTIPIAESTTLKSTLANDRLLYGSRETSVKVCITDISNTALRKYSRALDSTFRLSMQSSSGSNSRVTPRKSVNTKSSDSSPSEASESPILRKKVSSETATKRSYGKRKKSLELSESKNNKPKDSQDMNTSPSSPIEEKHAATRSPEKKSQSNRKAAVSSSRPSARKYTHRYSRRGRRGGRSMSRRKPEPIPVSDESNLVPEIPKIITTGSGINDILVMRPSKVVLNKINVDSDGDTISDKGRDSEPVKTRAVSRQASRSGRRGRRGRGRSQRKVRNVSRSSTLERKKIEEFEERDIRREPVSKSEPPELEESSREQSDNQKKESDSATIEDSGSSCQNFDKDFFQNSDTKQDATDQDGGSDADGNDREAPSESTDEAGDLSHIKLLSEDKQLDINDCSSTSPPSTVTTEDLFAKCKEGKVSFYGKQWSPQSSAPTSQSAVTPATSESSDETDNTDDSEGTDQTVNSNDTSGFTRKTKMKRKDRDDQHQYKMWKKSISIVWREASYHKYANVFAQKVTDDVAPGYQSIVKRPMDLSLIKKNIDNGTIKTTQEFQRDMMLMFQNAIMYNSSDHDVYHMAVEMQRDVNKQIQDYLATQLIIQDKIKETSLSTSLRTARLMKSQAKSNSCN